MASAFRKITAAKWAWRGDAGWVDYDAKMNLHLENEYLEGVKRISVDGERFVDVSLTQKQIRVTWYCADCEDKNCIGLQRRIDDESKRRAVRREAAPFLKGLTILPLVSEDDGPYLTQMLTSHKATVKDTPGRAAFVVMLGEGESQEDHADILLKASQKGCPIVTQDWLLACFQQQSLLTAELPNYAVKLEKAEDEADGAEAAAPLSKSTSSSKKKAAEEDEEVLAPPAKKPKLVETDDADSASPSSVAAPKAASSSSMDVDEPISAATASSTVAATVSKSGSSTKSLTTAKSSTTAKATAPKRAVTILSPNTTWMGVCSGEEHVPFILTVHSLLSGAVEGSLQWPTLHGAETKIKGTTMGDQFIFTEYEVVKGDDQVEVGTEYTATLTPPSSNLPASFSGSWELTSQDLSGSFNASLISTPSSLPSSSLPSPASPLPSSFSLSLNASYQGTCTTHHDFTLLVLKRDGNIVEGTLTWPSLHYTSSFQGEIVGAQLKFSEMAIEKSDKDAQVPSKLPSPFVGLLDIDSSSIRGSRGDLNGDTSSFILKLN